MPKCLKVRGAKSCVKVDADVFARAQKHSWHMHRKYPATTLGSGRAAKKLYLHRFVLGDLGTVIDHRNGDRLDNRRSNLRRATKSQNTANIGRISTNKTGFKGVMHYGDRFRAFAHLNGQTRYLGTFDSAKDAACAYDREAKRIFGRFAKTNGLKCKV